MAGKDRIIHPEGKVSIVTVGASSPGFGIVEALARPLRDWAPGDYRRGG
jgi:hypothetical protein